MRTDDLFAFIKERHSIWVKRNNGVPKPWTKDLILQNYRFCNVYRELDTQTIWFANNWRYDDEDLWFASLVFRFVNWGDTCTDIGDPLPWNKKKFIWALSNRKMYGEKVYSGAYMISTHGVKQEKHLYLAESLSKIWKQRAKVRYKRGETLRDFHTRLMGCFDVGSFLAAQVIADCKYAHPMCEAPDWYEFVASGPGSRRGLNRVFLRDVKHPWKEENWYAHLSLLHTAIAPMIKKAKMPELHAQDLQNCLCEFDKYERVRLSEGRPKSKYNGGI
jgi:hypothetical protein